MALKKKKERKHKEEENKAPHELIFKSVFFHFMTLNFLSPWSEKKYVSKEKKRKKRRIKQHHTYAFPRFIAHTFHDLKWNGQSP